MRKAAEQVLHIIPHILQDILNGIAGNHLFDLELPLVIDHDRGFVDGAEQVMEVSDNILISAQKQHRQMVGGAVKAWNSSISLTSLRSTKRSILPSESQVI